MIVPELKRAVKSEKELKVPSLDKMLLRARQEERARRIEYIKKKLVELIMRKDDDFCDEDIDESPIETVIRGGEVAD